jgi:hypothetical protein
MTWRLLFPNSDINGEMMSPPWNNFFRSLLHFIVVRSGHDEGLGRISFRLGFLIFRWQKEKEGSFSTPSTWMLVVVRWVCVLRPFADCLSVRSSILQSVV